MKKAVEAYLERWRRKPYQTKVLSYLSEIFWADLIFWLHILTYYFMRINKKNVNQSLKDYKSLAAKVLEGLRDNHSQLEEGILSLKKPRNIDRINASIGTIMANQSYTQNIETAI